MSQLARDIFHDEDLVHRNEEGRNARECCCVNNHKKEVFAIEFGCAEGEVSVLVYLPVLHQKKSKRATFDVLVAQSLIDRYDVTSTSESTN